MKPGQNGSNASLSSLSQSMPKEDPDADLRLIERQEAYLAKYAGVALLGWQIGEAAPEKGLCERLRDLVCCGPRS